MVHYKKGEKIICPYDEAECDNTTGSTHTGSPAWSATSYQVWGMSNCHTCSRKDERDLLDPTYGWTESYPIRQPGRMCGADPNI